MSDTTQQPTTQEIAHLKEKLLKLKKFVTLFGALSLFIVVISLIMTLLSTNRGDSTSLIVLISIILVFVFIGTVEYEEYYKTIASEQKDELKTSNHKKENQCS